MASDGGGECVSWHRVKAGERKGGERKENVIKGRRELEGYRKLPNDPPIRKCGEFASPKPRKLSLFKETVTKC